MAGRRPNTLRSVPQILAPSVEDPETARAFDTVSDAVRELQTKRQRDTISTNLVIGANKVRHGLGRACAGYTVTCSVATIAFAHALNTTNPRPDLEVWIDVVGSDMPDALVEVF